MVAAVSPADTSAQIAEVLRAAKLEGVQVGCFVATMGPKPCAVEYSGCPGTRRGRLPDGLVIEVLELKLHWIEDYRYVAARFRSWHNEEGEGWCNLCAEGTAFVRQLVFDRHACVETAQRRDRGPAPRAKAEPARAEPYSTAGR